VDPTVGTSGQVPDQPTVDIAKEDLAGLGLLTSAVDVVEHPLDLGSGEIGGQR
jgi:hypothetical protein